jgi:hypothetical protein
VICKKGVEATRGFSISWSGNSAVWHTGHTVSKEKQNKQQTKSTYATKDKIQNCSTLVKYMIKYSEQLFVAAILA